MTPTSRSLVELRRLGYLAAPVEQFIAQANRKRDLFGIGDVLAVHPRDRLFLMVQATSMGHVADRLARCQRRAELAAWLRAGGLFEVWGWDGARLKRVAVGAQDLQPVLMQTPRARRRRKGERQGDLFN